MLLGVTIYEHYVLDFLNDLQENTVALKKFVLIKNRLPKILNDC